MASPRHLKGINKNDTQISTPEQLKTGNQPEDLQAIHNTMYVATSNQLCLCFSIHKTVHFNVFPPSTLAPSLPRLHRHSPLP